MSRLLAAPRLQRAEAGGAGAGERRRHGRLQRHPPQQRRQRPLRQHTLKTAALFTLFIGFLLNLYNLLKQSNLHNVNKRDVALVSGAKLKFLIAHGHNEAQC